MPLSFAPNTQLRLLTGVPLSSDYRNQLTFASRSAQESYFLSKMKPGFSWLGTFQRVQRYIAVPANAESLWDCNYVMFQNTAYGNKWFYGFVDDIVYVNDNTSNVFFTLDEWQTWYFDVTVNQCFVEREHVNSDTFGEHLIDEGLDTGDYITVSSATINLSDFYIIVATTSWLDSPYDDASGRCYTGIFSGCVLYAFDPTSNVEINRLRRSIEALAAAGKADAIVEMYYVPKKVVRRIEDDEESGLYHVVSDCDFTFDHYINIPNTATLDGYKPQNNKLLTYPYRAAAVTCPLGGGLTLKYEYFNGTPRLRYGGGVQSSSGIFVAPQDYKGVENNISERVDISNYPQCSWLRDNYANWLATQNIHYSYQLQNAKTHGIVNAGRAAAKGGISGATKGAQMGAAGGVGGAIAGGVGGLLLGGLASGADSVIDSALDFYDIYQGMNEDREIHDVLPPSMQNGSSSTPVVNTGNYKVLIEEKTMTADYARSRDLFLTMFGYKISTVKVPNITGRKYWNYVKTANSNCIGAIPRPSINRINKMFNDGVTFWHGDYVGDYSLDNSLGGYVPPPSNYVLTVQNGSGSGTYAGGAIVPISAPAENFYTWITQAGGTFENAAAPSTNFTMPSNNVVVIPTYRTPPPTPSGKRIDQQMAEFGGSIEWDNTVETMLKWYYGYSNHVAWCAIALTYCAQIVGVQDQVPKNAAVQSLYNAMYNRGLTWAASTGRKPVPGDICFFITSQGDTVLHHCGAVSAVRDTDFDYWSGNTSNPTPGQPDGIFMKTSDYNQGDNYYVKYFGHVTY